MTFFRTLAVVSLTIFGIAFDAKTATAGGQPVRAREDILMLVYPKFTALDLAGPHHVLSMVEGYRVRLVWKTTDEITSDLGLKFRPDLAFIDCPENPAIIFVPGGTDGTLAAMEDPEVRAFLVKHGSKAKYVTSVCTGSHVLGAAGLLNGYKATSHWLTLDTLKRHGAQSVQERVVEDRNRITGAGVTAGIDFALRLTAKLKGEDYAKAVQLMMEYDPQPPFRSGSPKTADAGTILMLREMSTSFLQKLDTTSIRLAK